MAILDAYRQLVEIIAGITNLENQFFAVCIYLRNCLSSTTCGKLSAACGGRSTSTSNRCFLYSSQNRVLNILSQGTAGRERSAL